MKYTLQSKFLPSVAPYLTDGSLPPDAYKSTIQSLHTSAVASTIASRPPNRVLQQPDPPIAEEEQTLSRPFRTTLAQLRSGFCPALNSYLERVGRSPDALCPSCRGAPHTTAHIFSRPFRTTLAQLRSGFCPALNSYLERVGRSPDALCPSCRGAPHTTAHIFSCPSHPTSLTVRDLWDRPCAVAEFLPSLPFPFRLPPLPRPPPEPPPSPP